MADGWAFRQMFLSRPARHQALAGWSKLITRLTPRSDADRSQA
jgi:hypothetical protein